MWQYIYHDITYDTAITVAETKSDIRITTDTSFLALTGELCGVYWEEFEESWSRYNTTTLHLCSQFLRHGSSMSMIDIIDWNKYCDVDHIEISW